MPFAAALAYAATPPHRIDGALVAAHMRAVLQERAAIREAHVVRRLQRLNRWAHAARRITGA